jgi:hypothetical protein
MSRETIPGASEPDKTALEQRNSRGLVSSWKSRLSVMCELYMDKPQQHLSSGGRRKKWLNNQKSAKLLGALCPNWKTESYDQFCECILPNSAKCFLDSFCRCTQDLPLDAPQVQKAFRELNVNLSTYQQLRIPTIAI